MHATLDACITGAVHSFKLSIILLGRRLRLRLPTEWRLGMAALAEVSTRADCFSTAVYAGMCASKAACARTHLSRTAYAEMRSSRITYAEMCASKVAYAETCVREFANAEACLGSFAPATEAERDFVARDRDPSSAYHVIYHLIPALCAFLIGE